MSGFGAWERSIGRWLVRCLVGKYGTIVWATPLALLVGIVGYLSFSDNAGSAGAHQGTVYSVAAVEANLAQSGSWIGRTIRVRGEIVPCMDIPSAGSGPGAYRSVLTCAELIPYTAQFDNYRQSVTPIVDPLPVVRAGLDSGYTILRGMPLVGRSAPDPQVLHWGVVATYRVQLVAVPNSICDVGACVEAKLLDSAP